MPFCLYLFPTGIMGTWTTTHNVPARTLSNGFFFVLCAYAFRQGLKEQRFFCVSCCARVCPEDCVFGVIDGPRWAGLLKEDRADEQCNEYGWCAV